MPPTRPLASAAYRLCITVVAMLMSSRCVATTEPDSHGVPVIGNWRYSGRQTVPGDADLSGALSFATQTGSQISGSLDFIETDSRGLQRRVAGLFTGRTIDSTTLDFDLRLSAVTRRHVGRVVGDSLTGTWIEQPAGGGAPSASGTFRGARQ